MRLIETMSAVLCDISRKPFVKKAIALHKNSERDK